MKILVPVLVSVLFCGAVGCGPDTMTDTHDRPVTTPDTTPHPAPTPTPRPGTGTGSTPDRTPDPTTPGGADDLPAGVEEIPADELPRAGTDDE